MCWIFLDSDTACNTSKNSYFKYPPIVISFEGKVKELSAWPGQAAGQRGARAPLPVARGAACAGGRVRATLFLPPGELASVPFLCSVCSDTSPFSYSPKLSLVWWEISSLQEIAEMHLFSLQESRARSTTLFTAVLVIMRVWTHFCMSTSYIMKLWYVSTLRWSTTVKMTSMCVLMRAEVRLSKM